MYNRMLANILAALLFWAVGGPVPPTATASSADREPLNHIIEIYKFKFKAPELPIKPGDTVTWINRDLAPHTATAKDKSWTSPRLRQGEEWTLVITESTFDKYFCKYHPAMKASLALGGSG